MIFPSEISIGLESLIFDSYGYIVVIPPLRTGEVITNSESQEKRQCDNGLNDHEVKWERHEDDGALQESLSIQLPVLIKGCSVDPQLLEIWKSLFP